MNSITSHKTGMLAIVLLVTGSLAIAQDRKTEQAKQKLEQAQKMEIMKEVHKAQQAEELNKRKEMLEQQQQKMRQIEREYADQSRELQRSEWDAARFMPYVGSNGTYAEGPLSQGPYVVGRNGQENQSQLTLRKSFRETTSTARGEFDVESGIRHFRCMISGSVRSGEIFIGIEYPDGKTFKELEINASADINFSQSVSVKEEDEEKYTGSWSYEIKAEDAEGNYMVQIMTN